MIPAQSGAVIAVDVGGTSIKAALVTGRDTDNFITVPTPKGAPAVVAAIKSLVDSLKQAKPISGIGVVVPGIVDEDLGLGVRADNLGWYDAPLRSMLQNALSHRVALGHDVRAGAAAEYEALRPSAGNVAFIPIGTGIAMGLIIDGMPLSSAGYAGEIGHAKVGHKLTCICGLTGCLEAIASASAIAARYSAITGGRPTSAAVVANRVAEDPIARTVWSDAVDALAEAIAWVASTTAPQTVILGGGLSQAGDILMDPLRRALSSRLSVQRVPRLVRAYYGPYSALHGAAILSRNLTGRNSHLH